MQIDNVATSLKQLANANPMAEALAAAGMVGNLHYGSRASRAVDRAFATFLVNKIGSSGNSSGVKLVTYEVTLTVYVLEKNETAAAILRTFHLYWDRVVSLPTLATSRDRLVLIFPGSSEIGEAEDEDLGKDVILGITSWQLKLSEHQPELVEEE